MHIHVHVNSQRTIGNKDNVFWVLLEGSSAQSLCQCHWQGENELTHLDKLNPFPPLIFWH